MIQQGLECVKRSLAEKNSNIRIFYRTTLFLILQKRELTKQGYLNILQLEHYMASFYPASDPTGLIYLQFANAALEGSGYKAKLKQPILGKLTQTRLEMAEHKVSALLTQFKHQKPDLKEREETASSSKPKKTSP